VEEALARDEGTHVHIGSSIAHIQGSCDVAAGLGDPLHAACLSAAQLEAEARAWKGALAATAAATELAQGAHAAAGAALAGQRASLLSVSDDVELAGSLTDADGLRDELQRREEQLSADEGNLSRTEAWLQELVEQRMSLTRQLTEHGEAERHWRGALHAAEDGGAATAPMAQECRAACEAVQQAVAAARAEAAEIDEQMRGACEQLPRAREGLACGRRRVAELRAGRGGAFEALSGVLDAQLGCSGRLQNGHECLQNAHGRMEGERAQRGKLRAAARALASSLAALDGHLESLELQDCQRDAAAAGWPLGPHDMRAAAPR